MARKAYDMDKELLKQEIFKTISEQEGEQAVLKVVPHLNKKLIVSPE